MFCTICAAPISGAGSRCSGCGASQLAERTTLGASNCGVNRSGLRSRTSRLINLTPPIAIAATVLLAVVFSRIEQRETAALYRRALAAEADGRTVEAGKLYASAGGYADAENRAAVIDQALAPYMTAYAEGLAAVSDGEYKTAISILLPIVRDLPDFAPAPELLEQARLGRKNELLRDARNAEVRLDWMTAERIYAGLAADDPDDPEIAAKLLAIRQERAVYLFTLRQRLYVANPINAEPVLVTDELKAAWPVWSPDRSKIAFVSPGDQQNGYIRALYVVDADGSNLRKLAEDPARWRPPLWSPDGKHIAFEVDGASVGDPTVRATVMVVDLATGVVTDIIGDAFPNGSSPAWSPDGDRLAFVVRGIDLLESEPGVPSEILRVDISTIHVMTMATGEITPLGQGVVPEPWRINWSPTSEKLLVFSRKDGSSFRKGALYRLNATTGAVERIARSNVDLSVPVWSPDGSRFAYTIETTTIRIVGSGGGAFDVQSPITLNGWLSWSPSSDRLLAMGQSGQAYSVLLEVDAASADLRIIELAYDSEGGDAGPPQWSSANPAAPPQVLTVSGTALDG